MKDNNYTQGNTKQVQSICVFLFELTNPSPLHFADMYGMCELMTSGPTQALLLRVKQLVGTEVKLMTHLQEVMGELDMLRNAAGIV